MSIELSAEEQARVAARAEAERRDRARKAALQKEMAVYAGRGYKVVSQSDYNAQMLKPKVFSRLWAFLWFLCFGVGLLVYLLWYMAKRDQQVYLWADEGGKVHKKG